jgi:hypothetical protein
LKKINPGRSGLPELFRCLLRAITFPPWGMRPANYSA